MSTLRKKFKVAWDDRDPVEVTTNARDIANAQEYSDDLGIATFALIHSALEREGYDPPELQKFIDALDDLVNLSAEDDETPTPT